MHHFPVISQLEGHDLNGEHVELGGFDTDGYYVGYIAPDGLAYESHRDAECTLLEGRFLDAHKAWRAGRGPCPNLAQLANELVSEPNRRVAMEQAVDGVSFWLSLRVNSRLHFPEAAPRADRWSGYTRA